MYTKSEINRNSQPPHPMAQPPLTFGVTHKVQKLTSSAPPHPFALNSLHSLSANDLSPVARYVTVMHNPKYKMSLWHKIQEPELLTVKHNLMYKRCLRHPLSLEGADGVRGIY